MHDKQNLLSNAQAIAGAAGTYVSTDKINTQGRLASLPAEMVAGATTDTLGNTVEDDPGKSPALDVLFTVTEQFVGGDSVNFQIGYDDSSAFGSPTILASTGAIAVATLKPGYQARLQLPPGRTAADIYLGAQYVTLGAGAMTAGKVTAAVIQRGGKPTAPGVFK